MRKLIDKFKRLKSENNKEKRYVMVGPFSYTTDSGETGTTEINVNSSHFYLCKTVQCIQSGLRAYLYNPPHEDDDFPSGPKSVIFDDELEIVNRISNWYGIL